MLKIRLEIDHRTFEHTNQGVTREHLNWHDVMDMMLSCLAGMGIQPEVESLLDYFGIKMEDLDDEEIDEERV